MSSDQNFSATDINEALISRFAPLKHMYAQAREAAVKELKERLAKDWAEWDALDEESQIFVLEYLKKYIDSWRPRPSLTCKIGAAEHDTYIFQRVLLNNNKQRAASSVDLQKYR